MKRMTSIISSGASFACAMSLSCSPSVKALTDDITSPTGAPAFTTTSNSSTSSTSSTPSNLSTSSNQPIFSAMQDEMDRALHLLRMDQHQLPYFIAYAVKDVSEVNFASILGSRPIAWHERYRLLYPEVRIGDRDFDSSFPRTTFSHYLSRVTVNDDYTALRKSLWFTTDNAYKNAIRTLEWKRAYLASNNMPNRLPDMTIEKPHVSIEPLAVMPDVEEKWSPVVAEMAAVFSKYPVLQKSRVSFLGRVVNRWYLNSEGTKVQDSRSQYVIRLWAECQAADGMTLSDFDAIVATVDSNLPPLEELKKRTDEFAQRLIGLRNAPLAEEYCGPVLFEGQAAAEFLGNVLAPNLGLAEDYIGTEHWRNPLKNAVGRKILPKFVDLIDDPLAKDASGAYQIGSYKFDDEGMPAEKVSLVEHGILKAFCQSRIPTASSAHSNGHSLDGHGVFRTLEMSATKKSSPSQLRAQLAELSKDTGLDYVLVVSKLGDDYQFAESPSQDGAFKRAYVTPSYSCQPSDPSYVYKLYLADGRRELVRGLEFRYVSLRAFRDIQAVGDDAKPYLIEPNDHEDRTLITPSFIVGELELTPVSPTHTTLPIMRSPLEVQSGVADEIHENSVAHDHPAQPPLKSSEPKSSGSTSQ